MLSRQVWDVVDKGLARGGVGRVPEGEDLEDAVAGLPPDSGSGEHEGEHALVFRRARGLSNRSARRAYLSAPTTLWSAPVAAIINRDETAISQQHDRPQHGRD